MKWIVHPFLLVIDKPNRRLTNLQRLLVFPIVFLKTLKHLLKQTDLQTRYQAFKKQYSYRITPVPNLLISLASFAIPFLLL